MAHRKIKKDSDNGSGNQKEDWEIFEVLCIQNPEVK